MSYLRRIEKRGCMPAIPISHPQHRAGKAAPGRWEGPQPRETEIAPIRDSTDLPQSPFAGSARRRYVHLDGDPAAQSHEVCGSGAARHADLHASSAVSAPHSQSAPRTTADASHPASAGAFATAAPSHHHPDFHPVTAAPAGTGTTSRTPVGPIDHPSIRPAGPPRRA